VVIASKFGKGYVRERHEITGVELSPQAMRRALEGSLQRLQTEYLDLYQLHVGHCSEAEAVALREALEDQVKAGKICSYGWSTDRLENAKIFAEGAHCSAIQQAYNIFEGNAELLAFCQANNLASINRGPLSMGLLTGKYDVASKLAGNDVRGAGHDWMSLFPNGTPNQKMLEQVASIREILTSNGRTVAQGALAWLWARSPNTIPIPGFKTMQQAEENARALEFGPLTQGQMR
jgi:aryl-alcohol dehydrogenase-like predicted oxidoreductase